MPAVQRWRLPFAPSHPPPPLPQGFDTSAGKKHEDAAVGAIKVKSTRGARQYMNRKVGVEWRGWAGWGLCGVEMPV